MVRHLHEEHARENRIVFCFFVFVRFCVSSGFKTILPDGTTYEGGYKNDMFHGKGKFIDPMGKVIEGTFKNGKFLK